MKWILKGVFLSSRLDPRLRQAVIMGELQPTLIQTYIRISRTDFCRRCLGQVKQPKSILLLILSRWEGTAPLFLMLPFLPPLPPPAAAAV